MDCLPIVNGFETKLADKRTAMFRVVRVKNKFHECDPTHFRSVLVNLSLHVGSECVFVEMQVSTL